VDASVVVPYDVIGTPVNEWDVVVVASVVVSTAVVGGSVVNSELSEAENKHYE
jgi:hypothetical protein